MLRYNQTSHRKCVATRTEYHSAVAELSDVWSLNQHLQKTCGVPRDFGKSFYTMAWRSKMMWCCIPPDVNLLVVLPLARPTVEQANELVKAARLEAAFRVEDLLNRAQDPHLANTQGKTPLCQAAQIGATKIAELLMEAGADKDKHSLLPRGALFAIERHQITPLDLSWATARGRPPIVRSSWRQELVQVRPGWAHCRPLSLPLVWVMCRPHAHSWMAKPTLTRKRLLLERRADAEKC